MPRENVAPPATLYGAIQMYLTDPLVNGRKTKVANTPWKWKLFSFTFLLIAVYLMDHCEVRCIEDILAESSRVLVLNWKNLCISQLKKSESYSFNKSS